MHLASACWPDLVDRAEVALFPIGSCEQHGPHLPFVTDSSVADVVARDATESLVRSGVRAVCAPVLAFGASGEHQHFPGTVSIGHEALERVLVEIGRSATTWADRIVFVNGHGGNLPSLIGSVLTLRFEGRQAGWVACDPVGADAHAGRTETSLMRALAPQVVRVDAAEAGCTQPVAQLLSTMRTGGVVAVSANGVLGDPSGASAPEGLRLLAEMVDATAASIRGWTLSREGRLLTASAAEVS